MVAAASEISMFKMTRLKYTVMGYITSSTGKLHYFNGTNLSGKMIKLLIKCHFMAKLNV